MDTCYCHIVRQTAFLSAHLQTGDTMSQFVQRIDHVLGNKAMSEACESVLMMRFALIEPSNADLRRLCNFSTELETHIKSELGFLGYLWRRLLIGK